MTSHEIYILLWPLVGIPVAILNLLLVKWLFIGPIPKKKKKRKITYSE